MLSFPCVPKKHKLKQTGTVAGQAGEVGDITQSNKLLLIPSADSPSSLQSGLAT